MNIKLIPSYKILLLQIFSIICFYKSSAQFTQIGSKYTTFGSAVSGQVIAISDDGNTLVSSGSECAYIFTFNGSGFVQVGDRIKPNDFTTTITGLLPSVSVSSDGKTVMMGLYTDNNFIGAAWIFTFNGTNFVQLGSKLVGTGGIGITNQGFSVALSEDGKTAISGGSRDNSYTGAAWIYKFNGTSFSQVGSKLVGSGALGASHQGTSSSLSANGNIAYVGGFLDNGGRGAVWVYSFNGVNYTQNNKLTSSVPSLTGLGRLGSISSSQNGGILVASGSNYKISSGHAVVFTLIGTNYSQLQVLSIGTGMVSSFTGTSASVSSDGKTIAIGGYSDNKSFGAIWTFTFNGVSFVQIGQKLLPTDYIGTGSLSGFEFGISVDISGDGKKMALISSAEKNGIGASWVYSFSGINYNKVTKLYAKSYTAPGSKFGSSASISEDGKIAIIGAPGDAFNYGIAYAYSFDGINYKQFSDPLINLDTVWFGGGKQGTNVKVSSDGSTVIVGAPVRNNYYTNNFGAVYAYTLSGTKFVPIGANFGTWFNSEYGSALAMSSNGKKIVVGAFGHNSFNGASFIYTFNGSSFVNMGGPISRLLGSGEGYSVAMSGDGNTYIAGAPFDSPNGAVYVYTFNGVNYVPFGPKLVGSNSLGSPFQGINVEISKDAKTIFIGSENDNGGAGAFWVFTFNGTNYVQAGNKYVATGLLGSNPLFGNPISCSNDSKTLLVGAYNDNNGIGCTIVYTFNGSNYVQTGNKLIGTGASGNAAQAATALSGDGKIAIISGSKDNGETGAFWVFTSPGMASSSLVSVTSAIISGSNIISISGGNTVISSSYLPANANQNTIPGWNTTLNGIATFSTITGLLTATNNGNGIVYLQSYYGSIISGLYTITITNNFISQTITGFASITGQVFGNPPITISGVSATSGLSVSYTVNGPAVNTGNVVSFTGAGTVTITATQVGNANYNAALPVVQIVNVAKANQSITGFNTVAGQVFGNPPITISGVSATSGLSVSYTVNGPAVNTGNIVSITGAGTVTVTATQVGNANYNAALPVVRIVNVAKATPILSFISATTIGIGVSALNAISNSTGAISYTLTGGTASATISGNSLTSSGAGSLNIQVNVAADVNYNAGSIAVLLTVTSTPSPTIVYNNMVKTYGDAPFVMTVSSTNSTGAITYSIASGMGANISPSGVVTITGAGSVLIQASQAGDVTYNPAIATATLTINKANPTLNITSPGSGIAGSVITVGVATNSTGSISGVVTNGTGFATLSGNLLSLSGVGVVTVTVNQLADANYNAGSTAQVVTILQGISQTITGFNTIAGQVFGDPPITISGVSATSGLSVSYTVNGPAVSTGNVISITGAGTVTITATQVGNTNYNAASPVVQIVNVAKANQSITGFGPFSNMTLGGSNLVNLFASATSGLPVNYSITGPASISGNIITVTGLGIVSIIASQPGDANYLPAAELNTSFEVMSIDGISTIPGIMLDQTITGMNSISGFTLSGTNNTITLNAIASSGLTVFYTVSGPAMVNENVVTIYDVGTVGITALQNGNAIYNPAIPVNISFTVVSVAGLPTLDMLGITNEINNVLIYPNPNNGTITVDAEDYQLIKIYTLNGNLIAKHYLRGVSNIIHIGDVPTGVYIVEFYSTSKKPLFRKITKR
ncbi:MAG: T9SS type A sorting domain-containing protein [Cytophagales bacterium]|nr:T9SS type A sorting domain-containing protein [Cytophagales bacterium]